MHAERQIDQILRRVVNDEKIAHSEKVFSLFELTHTELDQQRQRTGVPQELGLKVCILEVSKYGFILHHHVMEHQTDDQIAVSYGGRCQAKAWGPYQLQF